MILQSLKKAIYNYSKRNLTLKGILLFGLEPMELAQIHRLSYLF
jgi:hypothetical protein